jgi:hypothetical protein
MMLGTKYRVQTVVLGMVAEDLFATQQYTQYVFNAWVTRAKGERLLHGPPVSPVTYTTCAVVRAHREHVQ